MPIPPAPASNKAKTKTATTVGVVVARVECGTTAGDIVLELHRAWSPAGYDRAVHLFARGFFDRSHFFRTVPHFLVQFGISYAPHDEALQQMARTAIPDDPPHVPPIQFKEGTISYAGKPPAASQPYLAQRLLQYYSSIMRID